MGRGGRNSLARAGADHERVTIVDFIKRLPAITHTVRASRCSCSNTSVLSALSRHSMWNTRCEAAGHEGW